jgi:predicted amidophosphoribosyltransferase
MAENFDTVLAACGLYCGACYHYRASFYEAERLQEEAAHRGQKPEGFTCQGCRSDVLYIHPFCARCDIRACADNKGIQHCGLCDEFPCERLWAFQGDGRLHHEDILIELVNLRHKIPEAWLAEQEQIWKCACGESFSWYQETCHKCGAPLASYGPDPILG